MVFYLLHCHCFTGTCILAPQLPTPASLHSSKKFLTHFFLRGRLCGMRAQQEAQRLPPVDVAPAALRTDGGLCWPLRPASPQGPSAPRPTREAPLRSRRDRTSLRSQSTRPRCWLCYLVGFLVLVIILASGRWHGVLYRHCSLAHPSRLALALFSLLWVLESLPTAAFPRFLFLLIQSFGRPTGAGLHAGTWEWGDG